MSPQLDEVQKVLAEDRRSRYVLCGVLIALTALVAGIQLPPIGKVSQESGTALKVFGLPSDQSTPIYISVQLDSGPTVKARIYSFSQYKEGARVHLIKQEALVFGAPRYILDTQDRFTDK